MPSAHLAGQGRLIGVVSVPGEAAAALDTAAPRPKNRPAVALAGWRNGLAPAGALPLVLLIALTGVQSFDREAFGVLSPDIRETFGLSKGAIDGIAALTGAVPILFAVGLGYLGDRAHRLRMSQWSATLWAATAVLTGLAPVVAVLIAARLVGGVGLLTSETVYPSLLADYYPPSRLGSVFTSFRLGGNGVALLGSALAGVVGAAIGWRSTFVVLALPTFVAAGLLGLLREPARGSSQGLSITATSTSLREGFRQVRTIRSLRRTWVAAFLFGAGTLPFSTLLNNFYKDVYHVGDTGRGGITTLYGVGGLVGILLAGWISQRMLSTDRPDRLATVIGLLIVEFGVGIAVMALSPVLALSVLATAVLTIGAVGFLPVYTTLVALIAPPHLRAQGYAWSLLWYALGALLLTGPVGIVANAYGDRASLLMLSCIVVAGGLVGASTRRQVGYDLEQARQRTMAATE